ncbi:ADP-ribosylglycohydrolase family protein [Herbiconiux sp. P17]|uniref:ADP-ribosylglycohydrolase family protein n=1 Tax=Herbiconiux wuyangfengii TaxID=3342794 RepID=UPI0035BACD8E
MARDFTDAVEGCLLGGAIGDAFGAPVENWHHADITAQYGALTDFLPQPARSRDGAPGQVTDDSTLRHYLSLAIVERGGRILPEDYAHIWLTVLNPDRLYVTERIVLEKLRLGMNPWDTGRGQMPADAASMAIQPVGIINAGDPRQAYQDAVALAGIHQDGLERDAAATIAAGVAAAVVPGATMDEVLDTMAAYATFDVARLVTRARELGRRSGGDLQALYEGFYAELLDPTFPTFPGVEWDSQRSVAATSREVVPAVVAILTAVPDDAAAAFSGAAGLGRDADSITTVVGTIIGAVHGASALPPQLVAQVEEANRDFFAEATGDPSQGFTAMAHRLVGAVAQQRETVRARLAFLDELV